MRHCQLKCGKRENKTALKLARAEGVAAISAGKRVKLAKKVIIKHTPPVLHIFQPIKMTKGRLKAYAAFELSNYPLGQLTPHSAGPLENWHEDF